MTLLGCIADDLTGATDLANNLVRAGMRVIQMIGVPHKPCADEINPRGVDAIVVALKSRTIPAADAVAQSLDACRWLLGQEARQIYFKVCSTFDSAPKGNIGPVIEALMDELGCGFSIATPAFPDAGRTVYQGHLFVGDLLLSDTGMRNHPLTPMTDANLVRVLQRQLDPGKGRKVGLIDFRTVSNSPETIRMRIDELRTAGFSIAIADAINNEDLIRLGAAVADAPLVTAASGLALGLPASWGFVPSLDSGKLPPAAGRKAIVAGSCSTATQGQVQAFIAGGGNALQLTPLELASRFDIEIERAMAWIEDCWKRNPNLPLLVYSTDESSAVQSVQGQLGIQQAGELIEHALSAIARGLVDRGARQLILAGGETAGACIHALGIRQMQIGMQIDPGVPWCYAASANGIDGLHVALKSGNFGSREFFTSAFALIA